MKKTQSQLPKMFFKSGSRWRKNQICQFSNVESSRTYPIHEKINKYTDWCMGACLKIWMNLWTNVWINEWIWGWLTARMHRWICADRSQAGRQKYVWRWLGLTCGTVEYTVTYSGFAWRITMGSGFDDWIYWHFFTITINYSAIANLPTSHITRTRSILVFVSQLTDC
jgi:hypothetical protein